MFSLFTYHHLPSLPSNAWSVCIRRNEDSISVFHGSGVETRDRFFAEAVWNEAFDAEGMGRATLFFGTGCRIDDGHVVFMTSSDKSAPLFSLQRRDELMLSNSIFHLMELAGTGPMKAYPFYHHDIIRNARAGIGQPFGTLFHAGTGVLRIHFLVKIRVGSGLVMDFDTYSTVPEPIDYADLFSIYRTETGRIFQNGTDPGRSFKYGQTVLCSSGYDSLANAVVCSGLGSDSFLSVVDSLSDSPQADSGKGPLGWLNLSVQEVDRNVHLSISEVRDAEFALGCLSNYPFLAGCEELLYRRLLINGYSGDHVWNPFSPRLSNDDWRDLGLHSMPSLSSIEHRLRVGYIDVGPQGMFVRHVESVRRISGSGEMVPFHVGSDYERPVPRRIIEEAGIPRGSFAIRKMATAFRHFADPLNMHPEARREYRSFVDRSIPGGPVRWFSKATYEMERLLHRRWFLRHRKMNNDDPDRFRLVALDGKRWEMPWSQSFLFQWSFETLKGRYMEAACAARRK